MSYTILLIGFSYETSGEKTISSVILDIYRMYQAIGNDTNTKFYIITDIMEVSDIVIRGLLEDEVTVDILNFIPTKSNYTDDSSNNTKKNITWLSCNDLREWDLSLKKIDDDISKLLVYYTGHGTATSSILFPNRDELSLISLRNTTIDLCNPDAEIVYILDCCYSGSLEMPYRLETSTETYCLVNDKYFCTQNVLVLSSCSEGKVSYSGMFGSHFTSRFLKVIEKTNNLSQIIREIYLLWKLEKSDSTFTEVQIHSSYPTTPTFWSWIFKNTGGQRTDIYVNDNINCLIISPM